MKLLAVYLVLINIIGIILMYSDKARAKRHRWRIPERTLFLVALLGGSLGSIIGMYLFRHKTRHRYFIFGMPAILIAQILLGIIIINWPY